jgi:hypothetical protein
MLQIDEDKKIIVDCIKSIMLIFKCNDGNYSVLNYSIYQLLQNVPGVLSFFSSL